MNANTRIIFQRLQGVESEIEKLRNTLFALKTTDIEKYGANYEALSTDAALRSERITCQLRNLVYINDFSGKNSYLKLAADAQGIAISQEQEILSITLPGLLPKEKSALIWHFFMSP